MFGLTKCGKCENGAFKVQELNAQGANYKLFAVQCTSCSTAIGVMEYYDNGSLLKEQEAAITELGRKIGSIEQTVNQIAYALERMKR